MTPTERARRSDALYHTDGPKRDLCDRIALLESDNEELLAACAGLLDALMVDDPSAAALWVRHLRDRGIVIRQTGGRYHG